MGNERSYVFLGHTYESKDKVDSRIETLDFSKYNQIWLGGDILSETTLNKTSINYLECMFNISSPNTHWALGNHDTRNGNVKWITNETGRPSYYATYIDGITLLVLNTTLLNFTNDTANLNLQYNLIKKVCDTISKSSHLVLISHHAVWNNVDQITNMNMIANTDASHLWFNLNPNLKYKDGIYPKLQEVQNKGIDVIHIAGDFGQKSANYEKTTSEGIQFIGSGITANISINDQYPSTGTPDSILILQHDILKRTLKWHFETLQ